MTHLYYDTDAASLLDLLSDRRSPALVDWAEHYNVDVRHVLDVRDRLAEPSDELRLALAIYLGLAVIKPGLPELDVRSLYAEQERLMSEWYAIQAEITRRSNLVRRPTLDPGKFGPFQVISPLLDELIEEIAPAPDADAA